jgi:hypothetical protein
MNRWAARHGPDRRVLWNARGRLGRAALCLVAALAGCSVAGADEDGGCDPADCRVSCLERGLPTGACVSGRCACAGAGDAGDGPACGAVECHLFCTARGADYGECRGGECRCEPPLADAGADVDGTADAEDADGADADAGGDDGSPGECTPAEVGTRGCGTRCGTHTRACNGSCAWDDWTGCTGEGECSPDETAASDCDPCAQRVCSSSCSWGGCELRSGSECEWNSGSHWRCCAAGSWQFCLPSCVWSTDCATCTGCGC